MTEKDIDKLVKLSSKLRSIYENKLVKFLRRRKRINEANLKAFIAMEEGKIEEIIKYSDI